MEKSEIIAGLKDLIHDRESFITPGNDKFYGEDNPFRHDKAVLQAAIDELTRRTAPENKALSCPLLSDAEVKQPCIEGPCPAILNKPLTVEQLKIENAQLRTVITESDPNFFKRKCRVCGCDWDHPCNDHDYWVDDDLCSACAHKPEGGGKP